MRPGAPCPTVVQHERRPDLAGYEPLSPGWSLQTETWTVSMTGQVLELYGDPQYKVKSGNIIHIKVPHAKLPTDDLTFAIFPLINAGYLMLFRQKKKKSGNSMGNI